MLLLTGASGFIGKHLLSLLIEKYGRDNIVCLTSQPITECRYLLHNNYQFESDFFLKNGFQNIETIIHAGAFTPKKGSEANNIQSSNSNIFNTDKLLNASLPYLKKFIYLSTLDVYDNEEIISECTLEKPTSLYGHSKLYSEKMVESWGKENNKSVQILRIGHVYGPGEEAYQKIIPITIHNILAEKPVQIWGTGEELRSFIYIKDIVKAIAESIYLKDVGVINLVGSRAISINDLVNTIKLISNKDITIEKIAVEKKGKDFVFDSSKMNTFLLQKETSLEKGLKEEFEYMKKNKK
ncbi:SDR family oxidoreductase [Chryseobacterium joostei]|uniref:SDR family oxidoreductase n=1 Tax=Chryseobacterium joostei TaxID=112234 RepID=A0A1N7I9X6_9FLAO|nr:MULTISPECIES: NAD-dependent epimerase/dehydratase family protein [Chryseobacterium]AZB01085.1 SDR family oxidoreductase [Chryseobacterium joostei]SIS33857.1 UDP-glucose 4-epimerase/UDP-glucose 4,6-dehydratase [Chryseobacterium joostei]HCM35229.1 NAD(P)-dependent oxidoreductase [Chryseobacterium sp.]